MKFDINAAREAGYSDNEIAGYLATENKFDLEGALKSGYSATDVVDFLAKPPSAEPAAAPAPVKEERGIVDRVASALPAPIRMGMDAAKSAALNIIKGEAGTALSDFGKMVAGSTISGAASVPSGVEKGIKGLVRQSMEGKPEMVMPSSVYQPGLDTEEALYGPETAQQKAQRELNAQRAVAAIPSIPGAEYLSKVGRQAQKNIEDTLSPETKKAIKDSQVTGNLFKGEIDFGKDPSVRGYAMQAASVFGSMAPIVVTAIATKSPLAGGGMGGGMAADEAGQSAAQFIAKKTHEQLLDESPFYAQMIAGGATQEEARALTTKKAAETGAAMQGVVALAGDTFTGKLVTGAFEKLLTQMAGKSALGKTAAGVGVSSLEQGLSETAEGVASDIGTASVVPSKEVGEDSSANLVMGALGGFGPGVVGGLASGGTESEKERGYNAEQMAKERGFLTPERKPTQLTNFTPADSPTKAAGLVDVVVPVPVKTTMETTNVGVPSTVGTTNVPSGAGGGVETVGGVGATGPSVAGEAGRVAPATTAAQLGGGQVATIGAATGQPVATVGALPRLTERTSDTDLLARVQKQEPSLQEQPATIKQEWYGRRGDGYVTKPDAEQALAGRQRMFPDLQWQVETLPTGKFRLAGYETTTPQETALGTQTPQAIQAAQEGQQASVAATTDQSGLWQPQGALSDTEIAGLSQNANAESLRTQVQQKLAKWSKATGNQAPVLNAPDASAEAGVNVLGNLLGQATGLGQRVVAYSDPGGANGFAMGGVAFVNTAPDTQSSAPRTALHEIKHVVERIAKLDTQAGLKNTPAQQFVQQIDSIFDDMTDEGKRAYVENFLNKEELDAIEDPVAREARLQQLVSDPLTQSEMTADFLGNRADDRAFLIDLAKADPKGFEGFVKKWLSVIDNLIAKLRGLPMQSSTESTKVDQYVRDLNKAKMIARDALIQFRKGNLTEQQTAETQQPEAPSLSKRGAEKIGDFEVRTMKDGTSIVYGDPDAIRAQIPEDVKGRVTKEGIEFTTAASPRVKAALSGRTTAYSREGAVLDKLPMRNGKYLGAPEKFDTPAKIPTLRKWLRQLADEGAPGRYWYENSGREVLKMVGGDVAEARKFVALLAIYSPQAKVDANSTFALRAWAQYKAGQPISVKTGVMDRKAKNALDHVDEFWSGEKTGNFFFNLLREIDPSTEGKQGATIDMWMMRAGQYNSDAPTGTQYSFMENETNRLAAELGWEPQQVQAAIWVAMKARMENSGVKKDTEASSEKKGWIKYKDNKRVVIDEQKHRDNWLKHSFAHDPTKDDTQQAKFDFGDGLKRHIGQVSFEARPGRTSGALMGIHSAPYAQQLEFQDAVQKAFYDERGVDMLAAQLGLLVDSDITVPGVWQGEVSPSTQKQVAMAPAAAGKLVVNLKTQEAMSVKDADEKVSDWKSRKDEYQLKDAVDLDQRKLLDVYASVAGLVARQEGVGWHKPFYASTKKEANALDIDIGRAINPTEIADLEREIGKWNDDGNHGAMLAFISSPNGVRIVSFGGITNDILHKDVLNVASTVLPDATARMFASDGGMPENNWKEYPNGENYVKGIRSAGRSDVLDWARAVLAPRVQSVFEEFSNRYNWGDAGELKFSKRSGDGAGRDKSRSPAPLDGAPIIAGATGPDPKLVKVADDYAKSIGLDLKRQSEYVKIDESRARRIATAYQLMKHEPSNPRVKEAFQNLISQTVAQYRALEKAGYKFWFFDESNDPYAGNPWNAMRDLRNNQTMGVFATEAGFGSGATDINVGDNPLLADTGITWGYGSVDGQKKRVLANDLFRAVHDAFGHGLEGSGFRAQGEENAWQAHVRLFTGSAVGAITTETRGQNSWLNFGPKGKQNQTAKVEDTVFADQKTGLMPEWTWTEGRIGDEAAVSAPAIQSDESLVKVFEDLQESRGIKLTRAQERLAQHPMAEAIKKVNDEFYDIIGQLDEDGLIQINCK